MDYGARPVDIARSFELPALRVERLAFFGPTVRICLLAEFLVTWKSAVRVKGDRCMH